MRAIDSHFHWFPRSHFERASARLDNPRTERDGDGYRYHYNNRGGYLPLPGSWFDLEAGLAASEEATGPHTAVVCTTGVLAGLLDMLPVGEGVDMAYAYNEEIAKAQSQNPGRFYGTAAVPLNDTREALALVDHAIQKLDLRGINLPAATGDGESIDAARLDPFYARVEELAIPLIIHPTDFAFSDVLAGHDGGIHRTVGRLLDSSVTVLRLIFSGVLDRHPNLKIVHSHAGGLNPYQAGRIDKNARIPGLAERPSTYMKNMLVDTVAPQSLTIRTAVEFYGAANVLYGTDHPCWQPKAAREVIQDSLLSPEDEASVMSRNAASLFRIPLDIAPSPA
jgi:aminocarboxymuconate-semialdehyde decarboxylase